MLFIDINADFLDKVATWPVVIQVFVYGLIGLLGMAVAGWALNFCAKQWLGRDEAVPTVVYFGARQAARWVPVFKTRLVAYVEGARGHNRPPPTPKEKAVVATGVLVYFAVVAFVLIAWTGDANAFLCAYRSTAGPDAVVIEIGAKERVTDGFEIVVAFDEAADLKDVWADAPQRGEAISPPGTQPDRQRVGFSHTQEGRRHVIAAVYPNASPQRSVFLMFEAREGALTMPDVELISEAKAGGCS